MFQSHKNSWDHVHHSDSPISVSADFCSGFISAAVIKQANKTQKRVYLIHNSMFQTLKSRQKLKAASYITYTAKNRERWVDPGCLAPIRLSPVFSCLGTSAKGMMPPTVGWTLLQQSTIKPHPLRQGHRPTRSRQFFRWNVLLGCVKIAIKAAVFPYLFRECWNVYFLKKWLG